MTRQRKPRTSQFHQTVAPNVARMQSVEVTQGTDARASDALNAGAYAVTAGILAAVTAHGVALLVSWPTNGIELVAGGLSGLIMFAVRTWQINDSRLIKQRASFYNVDDEGADSARFLPTQNKRTLLVRMHPFAEQMCRLAQELPARDYRLSYTLWTSGKHKIFTRAEFERVRAIMLKHGICRTIGNSNELEVTGRGRNVLTAWASGLVDEDIVNETRPEA